MDAADERLFREFVAERSPALMRLAYLLSGGDQHAAEDLLQTVLAKTARRWLHVDEPYSYARKALYRQQVSWWRVRRRLETSVAEPPEAAGHAPDLELRLLVRGAMARLTARQRTVLVLRYFEDLPDSEVAELLGCSVGNVRSIAHRSLARLRKLAPELAHLQGAQSLGPAPLEPVSPKEARP